MNNHASKTSILFTLILSLTTTIQAATIIVDAPDGTVDNTDGVCSISEAIINANDDAATNSDCMAGNGADVIELTSDITLTAQYDITSSGRTGTPSITTTISIDGKGYTLQRDSTLVCFITTTATDTADEFRILKVLQGNLSLINITIANGCLDDTGFAEGGGLYNNQGALSLIDTTFMQNTARNSGGAIYTLSPLVTVLKVDITRSTFSGNSAERGGAIYNNSKITTLQNSTFSGNSALIEGGAIYNGFEITEIRNNTFSGNFGNNIGDAILQQGRSPIFIYNTIFHSNGSSDCKHSGETTQGNNNISTNTTNTCFGTISTQLSSTSLGSLADNDGPTMTHALLPSSEAIDAAISGTRIDQRGYKPSGIRDIGAYEFNGTPVLFYDGFEE